jgi:hypothetical protein
MKEKKNNTKPTTMKKAKVNLVRLCIVIIAVVVVYFCYFLTILLMNMNERVDHIDENLQIMVDKFHKTADGLEKTEKKIQDSWVL